jgi:hypothetical protein
MAKSSLGYAKKNSLVNILSSLRRGDIFTHGNGSHGRQRMPQHINGARIHQGSRNNDSPLRAKAQVPQEKMETIRPAAANVMKTIART